MNSQKAGFSSIDEYIASFPDEVQKILEELRATIKATAPNTKEKISYQIPTFELNGRNLVHFAAWRTHIGFYPGGSSISKVLIKNKQNEPENGYQILFEYCGAK